MNKVSFLIDHTAAMTVPPPHLDAKQAAAMARLHAVNVAQAKHYEQMLNSTWQREAYHEKEVKLQSMMAHKSELNKKIVVAKITDKVATKDVKKHILKAQSEEQKHANREAALAQRRALIAKHEQEQRLAEDERQKSLNAMHHAHMYEDKLNELNGRINGLTEKRHEAMFQAAINKKRYKERMVSVNNNNNQQKTEQAEAKSDDKKLKKQKAQVSKFAKMSAAQHKKMETAEHASLHNYVKAEKFQHSVEAAKMKVFRAQSETKNATLLAEAKQQLKALQHLTNHAPAIIAEHKTGAVYERQHALWVALDHKTNLLRTTRDHLEEARNKAREKASRLAADARSAHRLAEDQKRLEDEHEAAAASFKKQAAAYAAQRKALLAEEKKAFDQARKLQQKAVADMKRSQQAPL